MRKKFTIIFGTLLALFSFHTKADNVVKNEEAVATQNFFMKFSPSLSFIKKSEEPKDFKESKIDEESKDFFTKYTSGAQDLIIKGFEFIGINYKWGGNTPEEGMDCSGYVKHVFSEALNITLPRTAKEMSQVGNKISLSELKPGDLVFFNTMKKAFSHVGIYIGDNQFLHAPRTGKEIQVETMHASWIKKFSGARRIIENPSSIKKEVSIK